jgi:hypothetical protein
MGILTMTKTLTGTEASDTAGFAEMKINGDTNKNGECRFEASSHSYWLGRVQIPSVSTVIQGAGLRKPIPDSLSPLLALKQQLGKDVHTATKLYDLGTLDEKSIDDTVRPYLEAWKAFRCLFEADLIEETIFASYRGMNYGMTLDRTGRVRNIGPVILEIKTSETKDDAAWGVQLAGYDLGAGPLQVSPFRRRRFVLQLHQDGKWSFSSEYTDSADYDVFTWALGLEYFKRNHGVGTSEAQF